MARSGPPGWWHDAAILSRRRLLQVGCASGLGLGLADLLRAESRSGDSMAGTPAAQSIIHVFLPGGLPQQDSFDPKPDSPGQYRGELESIQTRLPGVRFSRLFPKCAEIADRLTVIRSMSHAEADHDRGKLYMYSGTRPNPAVEFPSMGSVLSWQFGPRRGLPAYVWYPLDPDIFPRSGFLSAAFNPFSLGSLHAESDPSFATFRVRDLDLPPDVSESQFANRRNMLGRINQRFAQRHPSKALDAVDQFGQRAYELIRSTEAREAFRIDLEADSTRQAYGMNSAGQTLLLARRLVEAGVRMVSVNYPPTGPGSAGPWDLHIDCHTLLEELAPPIDLALASLVEDLEQRGMLSSTLVMVSTEFGRTPKINPAAGRDHWSRVFSVVMAGGGFRPGTVHGASDGVAAEPTENAVSVEDLMRTVYNRLGIDASQEIVAPGDRPLKLVSGGRVLEELLV